MGHRLPAPEQRLMTQRTYWLRPRSSTQRSIVHKPFVKAGFVQLYSRIVLLFQERDKVITSPAGAVAKYCDECVCLCVRVSVCLSVSPTGYLWNYTRDLCHFLCVLPMSVTRSSSGTLTICRIAYRREGGDRSAQRGRSVSTIALLHILMYSGS